MLDYGIIGNCRTCALVSRKGSVEWMCYPDFDSPSLFAKILDEKEGGSLEIKPVGKYKIIQRYIQHTVILETIFDSGMDSFVILDFFPRYRKLVSKRKDKLMRQNRLVRIIKPLKGKPKLKIIYNPKPNYALKECDLIEEKGNLLCAGTEVSLISNISHSAIIKREIFELDKTKYLVIGKKDHTEDFNVKRCLILLNSTKKYWERWVGSLILPEMNRELIIRSAITLKLLTFSPTGAIVAAPTTSIPEEVGSERTWDYRFCWVRDAVLCADALKKIGRRYEAKKLLEFFLNRVLSEKHLQIMYGIHGEIKLDEKELGHLAGFKESRPVRVGNAAYGQIQHDIYGEIIDLVYLYFVYYQYEQKMSQKYWKFLGYLVKKIREEYSLPDSGIWEFRGLLRHYTYSKFMCCIGVDRAVKIAQYYGRDKLVQQWLPLREELFADICKRGFDQDKKAFTMFYGSKDLDASLLRMAYHEFLDKNDPRLISTVKAIYTGLRTDYLVQRYRVKDDFGKSKSAFMICSFWLVDALWYIGEKEKARKLFSKLVRKGNHLGLFSEDIDMKTGKMVGNFPQAYVHLALINSSILLSEWSAKRKKIDWSMIPKKEWF